MISQVANVNNSALVPCATRLALATFGWMSALFYCETFDSAGESSGETGDQYGRNEDKVLKCTNTPSDIDSIHNRRPRPSFGDIWSTARGPRHPPLPQKWLKMRFLTTSVI